MILEVLRITVSVLSGLLIAIGIFVLFAAWLSPKLIDNGFFRWEIGRNLEPSRANRTLVSVSTVLLGSYLLLSATGHAMLSFVAIALWFPLVVAVLKMAFQYRR